jgi:uncharacterized RDD family membrane protein YckC
MDNKTYELDNSLLANNGKRFLNYILDFVFIFIFAILLSVLYGIIILVFGLSNSLENSSDSQLNFVGLIMMFLYYFLTEAFIGRTFAKFITGTVVVDEYGEKPPFSSIFKRTLCRFIPFDGLSFLGNPGKGWHDSISNTYVVHKKELVESIRLFHEFKQIGQETD